MKYIDIYIFFLMLLACSMGSCNKYLNEKPFQTLYVPSKLQDLQSVLDNIRNMNLQASNSGLPELISDNYYVNTSDWEFMSLILPEDAFNYIWDKDISYSDAWISPYQNSIYSSNFVLDLLPEIPANEMNQNQWNSIKGSALFFRAFTFYHLSQLYCKPYSSTANTDPGIVLKLSSDINENLFRATVQQTYERIISDLKTAIELLPEEVPYPTRPCKAAALGALARTYLSMRDYANAGLYANLTLQKKNILMDYNTVTSPFPRFNPEIVFFSYSTPSMLNSSRAIIDTILYKTYDINDKRKTLFFMDPSGNGTYRFKGTYAEDESVTYNVFTGIATDEMYLIRAEASARAGLKDSAMNDLNRLMIKRWNNNGTWIPFTASSAEEAKQKVLTERRKELIYRGTRWSDLRRFNIEGADITLKRIIGGVTYTLPPDDPRWVMLMPPRVITPGIEQNIR